MEFGLIGRHLGHSYSREIHALVPFDYEYELKELEPDEIKGFMLKKDFKGINVTIPYKQAVIPYIDVLSDEARETNSVNTVVNKDEKLYGYNTDVFGLRAEFKKAEADLNGKTVMITGTGGVSGSVIAALKTEGAKEIISVSRQPQSGAITYDKVSEYSKSVDALINATPAGMYPDFAPLLIDIDGFTKLSSVIDLVYNPLRTDLVSTALSKGIKAEGGLYMLCAQGVKAASLFLGKEFKDSLTDEIFEKMLLQKENLVLIGMPSCGKTTVGKILADMLKKDFIDTDIEIENKTGMTIPEIFRIHGEEYFRRLETETIMKYAAENSKIIATGGGAVLNAKNIYALKKNGKIIFLDRSPEKLIAGGDRPLSKSSDAVKKLYEERIAIYRSSADIIIHSDGTPEDAAIQIKERLSL